MPGSQYKLGDEIMMYKLILNIIKKKKKKKRSASVESITKS